MSYNLGIDFGTTNSCVAVVKNNKSEVIVNKEGSRITPSFVYFDQNSATVGTVALRQSVENPKHGIHEIKRLIGGKFDDPKIKEDMKWLNYDTTRGHNGEVRVKLEFNGKFNHKLPEEISAKIIEKLRNDAMVRLNDKGITNTVITVPAYFNIIQKAAVKDAAKIAGFTNVTLLNEPTAAALAYVWENNSFARKRKLLMYDLGGGTFDVSVIEISRRGLQVLSVDGDSSLGGENIVGNLIEILIHKIEDKYEKFKLNERLKRKLKIAAEETKLQLTEYENYKVIIENFGNFDHISVEVSRKEFENINKEIFEKTIKIIDNCLNNINLSKIEISEILLVGGSSRIPKIQSLLRNYFEKHIQQNINADEAVALGAAIQAYILYNNPIDVTITVVDVVPVSINVLVGDIIFEKYVEKNSPLPVTRQRRHNISVLKSLKSVIVSFYEGNSNKPEDCVLLGAKEIKVNNSKKTTWLNIDLNIQKDGIISVAISGESVTKFNIVLNAGHLEEEEMDAIVRNFKNNC